MQRNIHLPQVELTMESVTVVRWLVSVGDTIKAEQPIMEVETQKAVTEVPSPEAGVVRVLCVQEDDEILEKALICVLTDTAEEALAAASEAAANSGDTATTEPLVPGSEPKTSAAPAGQVKASPAARKLARERGLDLATVTGSGPGGRITPEDVEAIGRTATKDDRVDEGTPVTAAQRARIQQMQTSLAEIPQFQVSRQMDVAPLAHGSGDVTFTHRLILCVAQALKAHPALRTRLRDDHTFVEPVSVAVAMETEHGLVAPVIREAAGRSLDDIAATVRDFKDRANRRTLKTNELNDGLFAISNLGMLGVDQFTPFVFHGQTAVLAIGRAVCPASGEGSIAWFTLGVDHRVVDGAAAARFLEALQQEIAHLDSTTS
ncbi:MAG: 2-oxo acid dehydrogenase subunit E2 [Lentisphaerae bacterium]|nr:2-oxo acid dehydrogenase subunit E2 [Lentisphaerota bacterium]